ncbi:MAG TPA: aconitase X [Thermoproteota archaeon]|nr:aconitase X [Thermoproteota archaeon]
MGEIDRERLLELLYLPFRASGEKPSLVRIGRAHISGVSYLNIGEAGLHLLHDISEIGMKVKVRTTLNPCFVELSEEGSGFCDPSTFDKQNQIAKFFNKMGVIPTYSCTPYLEGNIPKRGEHMAWAESSAVLYSNSVIGAWTNKESGIGALAAALIGATSRTGVHVPEGREPQLRIEYGGDVSDEVKAGALGYAAGEVSGDRIPLVRSEGLLVRDNVIEFLAAFGTSGGAPMAAIEGVSPHVQIRSRKRLPRTNLSDRDIARVLEQFTIDRPPEAVLIGCPHLTRISARELSELRNRTSNLPVYVFTSRLTKAKLARDNTLDKLMKDGVTVVADACIMWCGLKALGYRTVVTNSVKGAHYLRNQMHIEAGLKSLKELMREPT